MKRKINLIRYDNRSRFAKKGGNMTNICLEDATINYDGEWLSAYDLAQKIEEKMSSGDMKFANLASALEELNKALENSHTIDEQFVITKDEYNKLKALGKGDDRECIRKAIMAFIGEDAPFAAADVSISESPAIESIEPAVETETTVKKKAHIKCAKCKIPFEIQTDDNLTDEKQVEVQCPNCNAKGYVKPQI